MTKKRIILILAAIIVVPMIGLMIFIFSSPLLPPGAEKIIDEVLQSDIPELVKGRTGMAKSGDVNIWYEAIPPKGKTKSDVLLIMGLGAGALTWPEYFYKPLVDSGYRVIRFDHRGIGMSDWMKKWDPDNPFSLEDMAKDVLAVLDDMGIKKAHIIGISMGGMIAQRIAISHPDRVLTLTSLSSCGYCNDPDMPEPQISFGMNVIRLILRYGLIPTEKNAAKLSVGIMYLFKGSGNYQVDAKGIAEGVLYELRIRRGLNSKAIRQHLSAVEVSGSRYGELGSITVPTLVIHGEADPLIHIDHAKKYAPLIPNAQTIWIKGLGHDFPMAYTPMTIDGILRNFQKVEITSN